MTLKLSTLHGYTRTALIFIGLLALWWLVAFIFKVPHYILPTPLDVAYTLWGHKAYLWSHTLITGSEILLGFFFGLLSGIGIALLLMSCKTLQRWVMPMLIVSQSIPVFALAPILVLWFGFGMISKIIAAVLVIFFPVMTSFFDGLRRTETGYIELAQTMGASPAAQLLHVRLMAALPALGSGIRVAAVAAPVGAIIGEWVGSSGGLGYVMLNANARMQTATCFAALFILSLMAILLWKLVDIGLKKLLYWVPDSDILSV